ncbi:MAG: tyrosine-type recombinase/integrase [Anaerolineaceae bacterium]|nr:tyrosine-type recombinase/integrase [Anaerolineaceae bacterium]
MNHRPQGLLISKAVTGFLQFKAAEGLSARTTDSYRRILEQWLERQPDVEVGSVTTQQLRDYLNYMRTEYVPKRINGNKEQKLSSKSIRNIYVGLSAFFHWASEEFQIPNPMKSLPAPKFTSPEVEPFTKEEIEALLKACDFCDEACTDRRRKFTMRRATARRDRAIILTLIDSGLRASELCSLRVADLDQKTGKITIRHGVNGGAKGGKARFVYLGKTARKGVWRYLAEREDGENSEAPLYLGKSGYPLNRDLLRQVIHAIGEKAGVQHAYPHRFRHSFAIQYLRSGGDIFTLKEMLGHNSLEMVQHYARVADVDIQEAHRKASPADNWRL